MDCQFTSDTDSRKKFLFDINIRSEDLFETPRQILAFPSINSDPQSIDSKKYKIG